MGALLFSSKCDTRPLLTDDEEKYYILKNLLDSISNSNFSIGIQFQDLDDHFEVKLNDFEVWFPISIGYAMLCFTSMLSIKLM